MAEPVEQIKPAGVAEGKPGAPGGATPPAGDPKQPSESGGPKPPNDQASISQLAKKVSVEPGNVNPAEMVQQAVEQQQRQSLVNTLLDKGMANAKPPLTDQERQVMQDAYGRIPVADLQSMVEHGTKIVLTDANDPRLLGDPPPPPGAHVSGNTVPDENGLTMYLPRNMINDPQSYFANPKQAYTPEQAAAYRDFIIRHETGHAMFAINYNKYGDDFALKVANQYLNATTGDGKLTKKGSDYIAKNNPLHFYTQMYAANYGPDKDVPLPTDWKKPTKNEVPPGMQQLFAEQASGGNLNLGRTTETETNWRSMKDATSPNQGRGPANWSERQVMKLFKTDGTKGKWESDNSSGDGKFHWFWNPDKHYTLNMNPGGPYGYPWRFMPDGDDD